MTQDEIKIINKTVEVWNDFLKLPEYYPNDKLYMEQHIDAIQAIIMQRQTVRDNPEVFRNKSKPPKGK